MDPEWASVLAIPLTAFKALEPMDQERGPWLMHGEAHADIVLLPVVRVVASEDFHWLLGLSHKGVLNRQPKLLKWVLSLKPLAE